MSKRLFQRVYDGVLSVDDHFTQKPDCTKKMGISALLKVTAALRMLAYGASADQLDENLEMAPSTVHKCLKRFASAIVTKFGDEYLRRPDEHDIARLLAINNERGFPGMLGSLDCMHWIWKNCPAALAGQNKGKEKKPTVVLEGVASHDLWIWHASFGFPGSLNDLNILDRSPLFDDLLSGRAPEVEFTVNDNKYGMCYFLADGIYPDWPVFMKSLQQPVGNKKALFASKQEAARKDVERAFGVLQARFRIIEMPFRQW
eukprot:GHVU01042897.1.p1 GENE.GHVU01042897.1~~GHVU01042897.1.p1  ORF type:complete len:259 (-),score=20.79 GHVU01042897.1:434-1210(-)